MSCIAMTSHQVQRNHGRRAFTLLELVIAIGIIVLLAALLVTAGVTLAARTEKQATQNIITLLETAVQEFESESDRTITWGGDPNGLPDTDILVPFDMDAETPHIFTSCEVTNRLTRSPASRAVLAQISESNTLMYDPQGDLPSWALTGAADDPDANVNGQNDVSGPIEINGGWLDGAMTIQDAWGQPIRFIHPGRKWGAYNVNPDQPADRDDDGSVRTAAERIYGVCVGRRILIVSAGPDQLFGDLSAPNEDGAITAGQAADNIVSYKALDPSGL